MPMQVPRILLGQRGDVKKRVAPLVKAFVGGSSPAELDFGQLMSSAEAPGALFPLNPGRGNSAQADFQCYAFLYGVMEAKTAGKLDRQRYEEAFGWSLEQPWSFLGTLSQVGALFFLKMDRAAFIKEPPPEALRGRPEWYLPFLSATSRHWQVLAAEGERFMHEPQGSPREFTHDARPIVQVLGELGLVKAPGDFDTPAKVFLAVQQALAQLN
jgi:hypothetical protein